MIGICIPAHDEERHIAACLRAVTQAARHPLLQAEPVRIVVVLDYCRDGTARLAAAWPVQCLAIRARNVGVARATGSQLLLDAGARWLSHTDADTIVSPRWLVDQLSLAADVVCGTVGVAGWAAHGPRAQALQRHFAAHYQDRDGHRHVHGANLGVAAQAYRRVGGFAPLTCSEDQTLVDRMAQAGCTIAWTALPRVTTSARPYSRVEGGFATALRTADPAAMPDPPPAVDARFAPDRSPAADAGAAPASR